MFPRGRIGIASANASPTRGPITVRSAASPARRSGQYVGQDAKVEVTQPVSSAAGSAGARRETTGGTCGTDRVRGRERVRGTDRVRGRDSRGAGLLCLTAGVRRRPDATLAAAGRFDGSVESIESTSRVSGFGRSGRAPASGGAP